MEKLFESEVRLVITTFPTVEIARQVGTCLVESQLIACINLIPKVESIYQWKGKIETESEVIGLMKTSARQISALKTELSEKHPYDVPEMLVIADLEGLPDYLKWIVESVDDLNSGDCYKN